MKVNLPAFERAGVMVVGDVMLDRYWYGPTCRISPEAPVPVVKVNAVEERPGGAANVAMNIASLGANARLVGLTGIDDAARALSKKLAEVNVKCDFVSVPTHPTITKLRVLSRNQQLIRLDFEEGFEGVDPQPLHERINQALGGDRRAGIVRLCQRRSDQRADYDCPGAAGGRAGAHRSKKERILNVTAAPRC